MTFTRTDASTRAGRDVPDEQVVVTALRHDVGNPISVADHARIAAEVRGPDRHHPTELLEHVEPMVERVVARAHSL